MFNCPVCGSKTKYDGDGEENSETCPNKCYHYEFAYGSTMVVIFNTEFHAHYTYDSEQWSKHRNAIEEKIQYWKENDRYLARIMGV